MPHGAHVLAGFPERIFGVRRNRQGTRIHGPGKLVEIVRDPGLPERGQNAPQSRVILHRKFSARATRAFLLAEQLLAHIRPEGLSGSILLKLRPFFKAQTQRERHRKGFFVVIHIAAFLRRQIGRHTKKFAKSLI